MATGEEIRTYGEILGEPIHIRSSPLQGFWRVDVEDLESLLEKARELRRKGERIDACEKYYKVGEEVVKKLAERLLPESSRKARKEGKWPTWLLFNTAKKLERTLEPKKAKVLDDGWDAAYNLHIGCFHEHGLEKEEIRGYSEMVEKMLGTFRKELAEIEKEITTVSDYTSSKSTSSDHTRFQI